MGNVASGNAIAAVAAAIGDAARANILSALMGGRALAAGELAWHAGVGASTASGHLARLREAGLVAVEKQGRHRYVRLASPHVAQTLEALMAVAAAGPKRFRPPGPRDEALRAARTCFDHLAGRLAVRIADALVGRGCVVLSEGAGMITETGGRLLHDLGLRLDEGARRPLCRTCLDWSERRPHLAGQLGAALLSRSLELGWVERVPHSRAVTVTAAGRAGFAARFGIEPAGSP